LVLVNIVIIPHSGWDPNGVSGDTHWSTVFRNGSGILRFKKNNNTDLDLAKFNIYTDLLNVS
jgi:hypothetical protein